MPGVLAPAGDGSPARMTLGPDGEQLEGVLCAAAAGGGYDVSLDLVASMVALNPLGERIVERVRTRAAAAGLADALASVSVTFSDIRPDGVA